MDDHIIQDLFRRPHQKAVKIQIALAGAAAPPAFLIADRDPPVSHADDLGKMFYLRRDHLKCLIRQCPDLIHGKGLQLRHCLKACFHLFQVVLYPFLFFSHKLPYLAVCGAQGHPDDDAKIRPDLNGHSLSLTSNYLYLHLLSPQVSPRSPDQPAAISRSSAGRQAATLPPNAPAGSGVPLPHGR